MFFVNPYLGLVSNDYVFQLKVSSELWEREICLLIDYILVQHADFIKIS